MHRKTGTEWAVLSNGDAPPKAVAHPQVYFTHMNERGVFIVYN